MLVAVIILIVIATGCIIMALVLEKDSFLRPTNIVCGTMAYVVMCAFMVRIAIIGNYNDGQIDALKGVQAYKIHYVYPEGDTIPSDTLYLKIK